MSMVLEVAAFTLSIITASVAGLVGCFAVMRRMTLAADAFSHVALPGIGIALALGIHPLFGATAMLMFGALIIWALERRTRIATETIIGVVFSTALAVGSLMSSGEQLVDALFGGPGALTIGELAFGAAAAIAIGLFIFTQRDRLILWLVSPEIARTAGINVARLNLMFLMMFALTVALGLRYLGVLLMGSLIIIPAVTAKRLARNLFEMLGYAIGVAIVATVAGTLVAHRVHRPTGPIIITASAALFAMSLIKRRR
jgi:zinc transport system permease protein